MHSTTETASALPWPLSPIRPDAPSWPAWPPGEASVSELAAPFNMTLPGVSKHLKVLRRAGLIEQGREAQWRPCRLQAEPLKEVANWVERYREFWDESFQRLDEYLLELQHTLQNDENQDGHQE